MLSRVYRGALHSLCVRQRAPTQAEALERSSNSKTAWNDRQLAFRRDSHVINFFLQRNLWKGSMGFLSCSITLPHDFLTQVNGLCRLTACDKSLNLISMPNLNRLNNRSVFNKACNIVSDVLPSTPRIEAAR